MANEANLPKPSDKAWKVQLAIALAAVFALAVLWRVPQWQVDRVSGLDSKERFDRINQARITLAQIIGGIAVLAGFYATVKNINLSQKSFALAQQGQITDRFTKAIEQLGAVDSKGKRKLEVRLGGIYALERYGECFPTLQGFLLGRSLALFGKLLFAFFGVNENVIRVSQFFVTRVPDLAITVPSSSSS